MIKYKNAPFVSVRAKPCKEVIPGLDKQAVTSSGWMMSSVLVMSLVLHTVNMLDGERRTVSNQRQLKLYVVK